MKKTIKVQLEASTWP